MQIYFHSRLCSYLPRVLILVEGTVYIVLFFYICNQYFLYSYCSVNPYIVMFMRTGTMILGQALLQAWWVCCTIKDLRAPSTQGSRQHSQLFHRDTICEIHYNHQLLLIPKWRFTDILAQLVSIVRFLKPHHINLSLQLCIFGFFPYTKKYLALF